MYAIALAGQALVVLLMATVSYWGSKRIDPETRIRARTISLDSTIRSKKMALVAPPLVGFVVFLGTLGVNDSPNRDTGSVLGLGVLVVLLLAHRGTVKRAAR